MGSHSICFCSGRKSAGNAIEFYPQAMCQPNRSELRALIEAFPVEETIPGEDGHPDEVVERRKVAARILGHASPVSKLNEVKLL